MFFTPFSFINIQDEAGAVIFSAPNVLLLGSFDSYSNNNNVHAYVRLTNSGSIDTTYSTGSAFPIANSVHNIVVEPNGKVLLAGSFYTFNDESTTSTSLTRLTPDARIDSTWVGFHGGGTTYVLSRSASKYYIGGIFTTFNSLSRNRFVRTNDSGTLDNTFNIGTGFNGDVYCYATQSDGKVLVGGAFTTYSGSAQNRIVRLNIDGTIDTSFSSSGANGSVNSIAVQDDGKIMLAGAFLAFDGTSSIAGQRLTRLTTTGKVDTTFNKGNTGVGGTINGMLKTYDGKYLITGIFQSYSGSNTSQIIRVNVNGDRDTTFNSGNASAGTGFSLNATSYVNNGIVEDLNGNIYVGNFFSSYSGSAVNNIVKIKRNGTIDTTFNTGSARPNVPGFNYQQVLAIQRDSNDRIYAGGDFSKYIINATSSKIVQIDPNGNVVSTGSFNVGSGFTQSPIFYNQFPGIKQSDGKFVLSGGFTSYSGSARNRILRLNTNGTIDASFNIGTGFNGYANDIKQQTDNKLLFAGGFTTYSGSTVNRIVRINENGTRDTSFNMGSAGFNSNPYRLALQSTGKIVVAGLFTTYSGSTVNRIVRLNTNGDIDVSFKYGTSFNSTVWDIVNQADDKIIAVGAFTTYSGSTANRIVRLNTDGTIDPTFNVGLNGANSTVHRIGIDPTTQKIVIAGAFQQYSGSNVNKIARLNTDGTVDTTFKQGSGFVRGVIPAYSTNIGEFPGELKIDNNSSIYITGVMSWYSGSFINNFVKINSDGTIDTTMLPNTTNIYNTTGIDYAGGGIILI